jgi:predicted PurR-regulated permease PerM
MSFNILEFARVNKVILIWTAFGFLIYIMRDLFGLVFITFVLSFVSHSVSRFFTHVLRVRRRRLVVCGIYAALLLAIATFIVMGFPRILAEARDFTLQLPQSVDKVEQNIDSFIESNPSFRPFLEKAQENITLDALVSRGWTWGRSFIAKGWQYVSWFFVAILFSFLIVFELPELMQKFRSLRFTRLNAIYDETVSSVIQFGKVVGENFKAQIYISAINTAFTFAGLTLIGTGMTALLSVVVFACGLVPVMGVFISSVPIMLVAINTGGPSMLTYVLILIVVIHAIEAYVLNPRIVSSVFHVNPVITLIILYVAHGLMGMWGMFLGVPISVYIYSQLVNHRNGRGQAHNGHEAEASGLAGGGPAGGGGAGAVSLGAVAGAMGGLPAGEGAAGAAGAAVGVRAAEAAGSATAAVAGATGAPGAVGGGGADDLEEPASPADGDAGPGGEPGPAVGGEG